MRFSLYLNNQLLHILCDVLFWNAIEWMKKKLWLTWGTGTWRLFFNRPLYYLLSSLFLVMYLVMEIENWKIILRRQVLSKCLCYGLKRNRISASLNIQIYYLIGHKKSHYICTDRIFPLLFSISIENRSLMLSIEFYRHCAVDNNWYIKKSFGT